MRFFEFADAEAQLGLLRTIIDNTWTAIAKQAEEQKRAEAQRKANAKLKPHKRKGGMGLYLGIGMALSFGYIMLQTVSSTFAINANLPPIIAAWIPNIIFTVVAYFCYRHAPN